MTTLLGLFVFVLGLIIGSFLNVVGLRYNTGMGIKGRSKCFSCSKTLQWLELIPLASFLIQRGKCKSCSCKISWQYPLIEALTGFLFVIITFAYVPTDLPSAALLVAHLVVACLLVVILIYDSKHKIIPDPLVYTFIIITGIMLFIGGGNGRGTRALDVGWQRVATRSKGEGTACAFIAAAGAVRQVFQAGTFFRIGLAPPQHHGTARITSWQTRSTASPSLLMIIAMSSAVASIGSQRTVTRVICASSATSSTVASSISRVYSSTSAT